MLVLVTVSGLAGAASVTAAPAFVSFEGRLPEAWDGALDGEIDLVVRIIDRGGHELWSESHRRVQLADGHYHILLGSLVALSPALFDHDERWLEIESDGEIISPATAFASVPYALRASCEPGTIVGCYTGDLATLGIGTCRAGTRICGEDGRYRACVGEILPAPDSCAPDLDQSCDGAIDCSLDPFCGDRITNGGLGEECDDGNLSNEDACLDSCRLASCGDGHLQRGVEECEGGGSCATVCDTRQCQTRSCDDCRCAPDPGGLTCKGEHYDADDRVANGCEATDSPAGYHRRSAAFFIGRKSCDDTARLKIDGRLVSDRRTHDPKVADFDAATGSAPDWVRVYADGGLCENDVDLTLTVDQSKSPACYRLRVVTSQGTNSCQTNASGSCRIMLERGAYGDDTEILLEVSKTCGRSLTESVRYSVQGHL